ncbi:hypothetical protein ABKT77_09200 [Enterobacter cloacae]|uniref:hypothetical protein n=1 Tax=Enterobacter cloacae TaxID=550 RepID=UPI0020032071|nr:hypothetical protein [Enterobacter cloacae]MCK6741607.1 hypothetical protein [Enterobacter cloacae]MCK6781612.1 hypothetical protein [Enterobacter cloacae]
MNKFNKIMIAAGLGILCSSNVVLAAPQEAAKTLSIPSYNIIAETLIRMTPSVNGKRNDGLLQEICAIAQGAKNKDDVVNSLKGEKVDRSTAVLLNSDLRSQQSICTAWMASTLFDTVNTSAWMMPVKSESVKKPSDSEGWKFWKKKEAAEVTKQEQHQLDQQRFFRSAQSRLNIAQADAELFGVIAANMEASKDISTFSGWQQKVAQIVTEHAPSYLNKIKLLTSASNNNHFVSFVVKENSFAVLDSNGYELSQAGGVPLLRVRGVDWLGNGKILGKEYFVSVNIK